MAVFRILAVALASLAVLSCEKTSQSLGDTAQVVMLENKGADQMKQTTGMPFDGHCSSIHYYFRSGGLQDLTMLCRFACDEGEVERIVKEMIRWNDGQIGKPLPRAVLLAAPFHLDLAPREESAKLPWWTPHESRIVKSVICEDGFGCSFWISKAGEGKVEVFAYQKP